MGVLNFKTAMEAEESLLAGVGTGLIARERSSNPHVRPQLVYNNGQERTILSSLVEEIRHCASFGFSVAFVTDGGLAGLKLPLRQAHQRGVRGRILTSTFLAFNSPKSFRELLKLEGVEVRVYEGALHTKGYHFSYAEHHNLYVGSANLTQQALQSNHEWMLRVSSLEEGQVLQDAETAFEAIWAQATPLTEDFIAGYAPHYESTRRVLREAQVVRPDTAKLQPNIMQREALASLAALRERGERKALIISATGTGKTYVSAFDVRAQQPKRCLFLAHREQLLGQAMESYDRVLSGTRRLGLYTGTSREAEADFLFATVQTLSKSEHLHRFAPDAFDYIVVDEVHRAGAASYKKILEYFTPQFLLGMTATPERSDGGDIYALFDYQIAYEIRLQGALEAELLCPFHYYGVQDVIIDDISYDREGFTKLTSEARARHMLETAAYYGHAGDRVKGLVFCSRVEEAEGLAARFTALGYPALALGGKDSQEARQAAIQRLVGPPGPEALSYLITVDIFNEGVDIPEVNQVLLARPTESAIVFVQQLGRGLRKAAHKEYVNVIDFIANYARSYLVPVALSGDRSYRQDNLRRAVSSESRMVPGVSTVQFEEIIRQHIYRTIDAAKLNDIKDLRQEYERVKQMLGHIPTLTEFDRFGERSIYHFFENKNCSLTTGYASYYAFLVKYDKTYEERMSERASLQLGFVSMRLARGKRRAELEVLQALLTQESCVLEAPARVLQTTALVLSNGYEVTQQQTERNREAALVTYEVESPTRYRFTRTALFAESLAEPVFVAHLQEVLAAGFREYEKRYAHPYGDMDFVIGEKYTYEEVCRFLGWEKNLVPLNIGGYKYDAATNTFPVFINYHKGEAIQASIQYEDRFLDEEHFVGYSKNKRTLASEEIRRLQRQEENGMLVPLFVRKEAQEEGAKEFYFLGTMQAIGPFEEVLMGSGDSAVAVTYRLDVPVAPGLYEYIVGE